MSALTTDWLSKPSDSTSNVVLWLEELLSYAAQPAKKKPGFIDGFQNECNGACLLASQGTQRMDRSDSVVCVV